MELRSHEEMLQIIGPREMNWKEKRGEGGERECGHGYVAIVVVRIGQCKV